MISVAASVFPIGPHNDKLDVISSRMFAEMIATLPCKSTCNPEHVTFNTPLF